MSVFWDLVWFFQIRLLKDCSPILDFCCPSNFCRHRVWVGGWWGGWCWGLFSHLSNGTFSTDSVQIYDTCITHSWEIYIKFMTILIFIHDIFMKHLWYKWYILGMTHYWHIHDIFMTHYWHIYDTFITHSWYI